MLQNIDNEIEKILYEYLKTKSDTATEYERNAEAFLINYFESIDYFRANPQYYGSYKISNDPLSRAVSWALVKGVGNDTVVFMHHSDTVGTEDFKLLRPFAYSPNELEDELHKIKHTLNDETREDLNCGQFIFGRGTADMKAGGSIQLALLNMYSKKSDLKGNILLIAVPDEENLSAGMRSAVQLLYDLKEHYGLNYSLMINSEPHQRKDKNVGVISEGSVGKLMPFVYVRGYLSHAGKVFEGFNPVNLLSEIIRHTELNTELSDFDGNEASPPPTWLYAKDCKQHYDVSMPLFASGCFSVLTLNRTPAEILDKLQIICFEAFTKIVTEMNYSFRLYKEGMGEKYYPLPWKPLVMTFTDMYNEALGRYGDKFEEHFKDCVKHIEFSQGSRKISMLECTFKLVEAVYDYIDDLSPRVVIGLTPPYYPSVTNKYYVKRSDAKSESLSKYLTRYAESNFNQTYQAECYYTGISDLSYTFIKKGDEIAKTLIENMPLFGSIYTIPVDCIHKISMPCINIGPWGKDFHKLTERVSREDTLFRTPKLIDYAVSLVLGHDE